MPPNGMTPNLDSLSLSDTEADDTQDLFASPSVPSTKTPRAQKPITSKSEPGNRISAATPPPETEETQEAAHAAHEALLRRELSSLRSLNQVITGITSSLGKAKSSMETVSATVNNASALLTTWTRILSQTEHNQRLILNPNWQGASQDAADGENEEVLRRQEREKMEAEEVRRARERNAEKDDEERRRMAEGPGAAKSARGRGTGRGAGRGIGKVGESGYVGFGGQGGVKGTSRGGTRVPGRAGGGIGRGLGGSRGRGRGVS